jgi:hypothetical protein
MEGSLSLQPIRLLAGGDQSAAGLFSTAAVEVAQTV